MGSRNEFYLYSILVMLFFTLPAYADENSATNLSVFVETDKPEYEIGDSLIISGFVEEKKMPVIALRIFDPEDGIVSANEVEINEDSTFSKTISLESSLHKKTGKYSISLNYGKLKAETSFDLISESQDESIEFIAEDADFEFPEVIVITDKSIYNDGDTITIAGFVSSIQEPSVLIVIYDPLGFPTGFYFGEVDSNLEFSVNFLVKSGVNFKTEGEYSVIARYGNYEDKITFQFVDKLEPPETESKPVTPMPSDEITIENQQDEVDLVKDEIIQKNDQTNTAPQNIKKENKKIINDEKVKKKDIDTKPLKAEPSTKIANNLSVEDTELGKILNRINLNCDENEFTDIISYYDGMGPALIRLCKYNEAISYYDKSLIENPISVEALNNKGSALAKMGYFDEAISFYDSTIDVDSENIMALNNKANALASLGNYDEAITFYNKALLFAPDNTIILNNLEKTKESFSILQEENEELKLNHVVEKTVKIPNDIKNNEQNSINILEQISTALSSIGNTLFGFLS